jgi:aminoglycoside phosphotransferase
VTGQLARSILERVRHDGSTLGDIAGVIVAGIDAGASAKTTLIFLDRSRRPALVAKVARDRTAEAGLVAEFEALRQMRGDVISTASMQIPRALGLVRIDGRLSLIITGLDGEPMMSRYYANGHTDSAEDVGADFRTAYAWLNDLQSQTASRHISLGDAAARWADRVIDRYYEEIGCSAEEEALFADASARAQAFGHVQVPVCASHGDYWMGNLLVRGNRIAGVIDWERAEAHWLPFSDIYKFPTSYGFYLDRVSRRGSTRRSAHPGRENLRARWARYGDWPNLIGFAYAYFGFGWFPDLVRSSVLGQLDRLGIPAGANWALFPLFLAEQALSLPDPSFRAGYRSAIVALSAERESTWLWQESGPEPTRHAAMVTERAAAHDVGS